MTDPTPPPEPHPPAGDADQGDDGSLLGELQRFAASDAEVLEGIGQLLDDLQAAAASLPTPDFDSDAIWARVEAMAWGSGR